MGQEGASVSDQADAEKKTAADQSSALSGATPGSEEGVSQSDIESLLAEVQDGVQQAGGDDVDDAAGAGGKPFHLNELDPNPQDGDPHPMELLGDVELDMRIELGRTNMRLEEVLRLRSGSVVALDKLAGDPVDVYVNGRLVARGEVLVMNDSFCVRVTELIGAGV